MNITKHTQRSIIWSDFTVLYILLVCWPLSAESALPTKDLHRKLPLRTFWIEILQQIQWTRNGAPMSQRWNTALSERKPISVPFLTWKVGISFPLLLARAIITSLYLKPLIWLVKKYPDVHPLFHSDRGFQYTSKLFKAKLEKQGMEQSMSRVGRCIDNGPMEGFWGILKCEMYYLNQFETYEELVAAIEQFIHYYNHQRRQHKLNCLPPATYRSLLEAA